MAQEQMREYRLLQGRFSRYEGDEIKDYAPKGVESKHGHIVRLNAFDAARMLKRGNVTAVLEDQPDDVLEVAVDGPTDEEIATLLESGVDEIRDKIAAIDDTTTLDRIAGMEGEGQARKSALKAIADRIAELTGE